MCARTRVRMCGWMKKGRARERDGERERNLNQKSNLNIKKKAFIKFQIDVYESLLCSASCASHVVTGDTCSEDREPDKAAER